MQRVNVYADPDPDSGEGPRLAGWFDLDRATRFGEDRDFDGSNWISRATGSQWHHQYLYRTAQGRWVLEHTSNYQGTLDLWEFVTDGQAREWLLANGHDAAVREHFGEVEAEAGPNLGGRPEIGPAVTVRLPRHLLGLVDDHAKTHGLTRAEAVRRLLDQALGVEVGCAPRQPPVTSTQGA